MWKVCQWWMQSEKAEELKFKIAIATWSFLQIIFEHVKDGENIRLETGEFYGFLWKDGSAEPGNWSI